jgi:uncharacterized protein YodC (DUF2158 family)
MKWDECGGVGDLVRLRSGGPPMTVVDVREVFDQDPDDGSYTRRHFLTCQWFDGRSLQEREFKLSVLESAEVSEETE